MRNKIIVIAIITIGLNSHSSEVSDNASEIIPTPTHVGKTSSNGPMIYTWEMIKNIFKKHSK